MKRFEIILYSDGGPNDRGECVGYVNAIDRVDAKKKFAVGKKNANDIINTGVYQAHEISEQSYLREKLKAKAMARMFD